VPPEIELPCQLEFRTQLIEEPLSEHHPTVARLLAITNFGPFWWVETALEIESIAYELLRKWGDLPAWASCAGAGCFRCSGSSAFDDDARW
jgi:hypothetical protein